MLRRGRREGNDDRGAFLPEARDLLAHAEDVRAAAEAAGAALTGRLTVGCFRTIAPFLLPVLLEGFGRRHPEVELDFLEGPMAELEAALLDGRCEVAITYDIDMSETIEREALYARRASATAPATTSWCGPSSRATSGSRC